MNKVRESRRQSRLREARRKRLAELQSLYGPLVDVGEAELVRHIGRNMFPVLSVHILL